VIITYEIDDNLYVNLTNTCSNACDFCVRDLADAFKQDLWLEREPRVEEILEDIFSRDLSKYKELVFCGFGEPTERIDVVVKVCEEVKKRSQIYIRINTNGQGNRINNIDITPRFKTIVDGISISLNAKDAEGYDAICHSIFGRSIYPSILDFTKKCKGYVKDVQLSIVDCISPRDIEECKKIAKELGVNLKIRKEIK